MKIKLAIAFFLIGSLHIEVAGSSDPNQNIKHDETLITGYFEGTEPFWDMEIANNRIILHCANDTVRDTLLLSKKQAHTETYTFKGKKIFGTLRYSDKSSCTLDITEEGNPTHEIYFSYKNVTYMGCGKLDIQHKSERDIK